MHQASCKLPERACQSKHVKTDVQCHSCWEPIQRGVAESHKPGLAAAKRDVGRRRGEPGSAGALGWLAAVLVPRGAVSGPSCWVGPSALSCLLSLSWGEQSSPRDPHCLMLCSSHIALSAGFCMKLVPTGARGSTAGELLSSKTITLSCYCDRS